MNVIDAEQAERNERMRARHEQIARIIVRTGRADGITARQLARYDPRAFFATSTRTWLCSMVDAGYGQWLRLQPGPAGGRPTMLFILEKAIADRVDALLESSDPTNVPGEIKGPRPRHGIFTHC